MTAMSAEEGADRVAARWRSRRQGDLAAGDGAEAPPDEGADSEPDEGETPGYACESCGGHVFVFSRSVYETRVVRKTLPCKCGEVDSAVSREVRERRRVETAGRLGADHRINPDAEECEETQVDDEDDEIIEEDDGCSKCAQGDDAQHPEAWETDEEEWEEEKDPVYSGLRCGGCDHDIEFGFSHPDGGRIWPVESEDFKPWMTIPDRRFLDAWRRRGWWRPDRNSCARDSAGHPS